MKTVILAGGAGTRLAEETEVRPKPMVDIGGRPILWHVMSVYAAYGFKEFVVALGYKGEEIKRYFLNHYHVRSDLTVDLRSGEVGVHGDPDDDWILHLIDTGQATMTGGRVKRLAEWIDGTFMLTYGDGVGDVDVAELVNFHRSHGKLATITAVRPPARFGGLAMDGDAVESFTEKPQIGEGWINGGFFVLEPAVIDLIDGDETSFEREPLERLAKDGELMAFRHDGFWQCMDTLRDLRLIRELWDEGDAPWRSGR
jgi:glucose-1-phosphate cytidylyltransferase